MISEYTRALACSSAVSDRYPKGFQICSQIEHVPHVRVIETLRIVSSYVCLVTGDPIQSTHDVSPTTLHNLSERGLLDLLS